MSQLPPARSVLRAVAADTPVADTVTLDYEDRFLRRKVLTTEGGARVLIDLPETMSLDEGDCFEMESGALIRVLAAPEPLIEILAEPAALVRLAWHIGNRHTPCQIEPTRLLIREDRVMADMLSRLGAHMHGLTAPFTPEGGAYGMGRTHGHSHREDHAHSDSHSHSHSHAHSHAGHSHGHAHSHSHSHAHDHSHDD